MASAPPHRWVDTTAALASVAEAAAGAGRYAIDTEFHRERTYRPQVALLQLAWLDEIALVDALAVDLRALEPLLVAPATAVMHAASQDLEVLELSCGRAPARIFDTQIAAGFLGLGGASLGLLVREVIGEELPKAGRMTDWLARPLGDPQRAYAASDVHHLLALHTTLDAELRSTARDGWAAEECERLRVRSRAPQDPETAWWRLKDATQLRGRSRMVAQAVAAWRERKASERDRPPRMILPDLALVTIASDPPQGARDLRGRRGLDERHLRKGQEAEILAAVGEGLSMPPDRLRLPPREPTEGSLRPALTLISAWVSQLGRDLLVDPALLATKSDVVAYLHDRQGSRLSEGWRAELIGSAVRRLAEGKAAVAFEAEGRLVLEARSFDGIDLALPRPTAPWARSRS